MTYEPNPAPGETETFASIGGRPLAGRGFASLTAGLLARKGEAEPALEPFAQARVAPGSARQMTPGARHQIDKPARGDDAPKPEGEEKPAAPAIVTANDDAPRMPEPHEKRKPPRASEGDARPPDCPRKAASPKKAAVTFRMTTHDFLRLKLAGAELEMSGQDIIIAAIEAFLDEKGVERLDECLCLQKAAKACEARRQPREDAGEGSTKA